MNLKKKKNHFFIAHLEEHKKNLHTNFKFLGLTGTEKQWLKNQALDL